tara:strand:- start:1301 stop:1438 length:138 start_codon:yes stop_codon:yes gene_type:complete
MIKKRNNIAKTLWENFRHKVVKPKKGKGSFKRTKNSRKLDLDNKM